MTLNTNGVNLEISFYQLIKGHVDTLETEINTLLSKAYSIDCYFGQAVESFPSVQVNFFSTGGQDGSRHRLVDRIQIDTRTNNTQESERKKLNRLIRDGLSEKIGFTPRRNAFYAYFPVKDFLENPSSATRQQNARIELFSTSGWLEVPEENPDVLRWELDVQIFYK